MTLVKLSEASQKLVEENMRLVPYALSQRFSYEIASNEDNISIGYIGLCKASELYNPDMGIKFSTFAVKCIQNEVLKHFRHERIQRRIPETLTLSLNQKLPGDEDETEEYIDMVIDPTVNIEKEVVNRIVCEDIWPLVPTFEKKVKENLDIRNMAKQEHKTRQGIFSRMNRELLRARKVLADQNMMSIEDCA